MEDLAGEVLRRLAVEDYEPSRALALQKRVVVGSARDGTSIVLLRVHVKTGNAPTFILHGHGFNSPVCTTVMESAAELFRVSGHDRTSRSVTVDLVDASSLPCLRLAQQAWGAGTNQVVTTLFKSPTKNAEEQHVGKLDEGDHTLSPKRETVSNWLHFLLVHVQPLKA